MSEKIRIWFNNTYGYTQVYGEGAQILCYMDSADGTKYLKREADLEIALMHEWEEQGIAVPIAAKCARLAVEMVKSDPGLVVEMTLHPPDVDRSDLVTGHAWQPVYEKTADPFPARHEQCAKCGGRVMYVGDAPLPTGKYPPELAMDDCPADR